MDHKHYKFKEMNIEKEKEEQIVNFGVFGYDSEKMANILGVSKEEIENEMKDENSTFYKLLEKGRDRSDYVIDLKLFEMAQSGDIKALEKLDSRKEIREKESKKRIKEKEAEQRREYFKNRC